MDALKPNIYNNKALNEFSSQLLISLHFSTVLVIPVYSKSLKIVSFCVSDARRSARFTWRAVASLMIASVLHRHLLGFSLCLARL